MVRKRNLHIGLFYLYDIKKLFLIGVLVLIISLLVVHKSQSLYPIGTKLSEKNWSE
ncbi:hypothetical protein ACVLD2_001003 [Paenibacillus sp. PvR052]|nr:hypothetical protein [Paenibacillus sp. PvP091]MBP1169525.1 hypothetical protein [Paenibacillus sp. PvR098]MBP2440553.1 hypothetical protein [Paenibacillus sp. PvP052]